MAGFFIAPLTPPTPPTARPGGGGQHGSPRPDGTGLQVPCHAAADASSLPEGHWRRIRPPLTDGLSPAQHRAVVGLAGGFQGLRN